MAGEPGTTRRGFLALAGSGAALAAIAGLGPGAARAAVGDAEGRFFDDAERETLRRVVERMVATGEPDAPAVGDTRALDVIDRLCGGLDPELSAPLPWLMRLVEWGPLVFDFTFTRFSRMSDAERDDSLRCWMQSRLGLRRQAFYALRNLAFLGWWSQEETWPLVGYAGPLLRGGPRP